MHIKMRRNVGSAPTSRLHPHLEIDDIDPIWFIYGLLEKLALNPGASSKKNFAQWKTTIDYKGVTRLLG